MNGSGGGMAESAPLVCLDAKAGHALEVLNVSSNDRVASMAESDRCREQVREAHGFSSASNRPCDSSGSNRAPPLEREEIHLVQEVLDSPLLDRPTSIPQVLDAQVEFERAYLCGPERLFPLDCLDLRFRSGQVPKDID